MKRDSINYVLVGVAVLVAFGLLLATLMAITGRAGASSEYHVYYDNVTGLGYGAPVFYEGFRIGQVSGIEPERGATSRIVCAAGDLNQAAALEPFAVARHDVAQV